jgi:hypothetical protein
MKAKLQCHGFPEVLHMMPTLLLAYHHGRTGTSDPYFQSLEYNEYGVIDFAPVPTPWEISVIRLIWLAISFVFKVQRWGVQSTH